MRRKAIDQSSRIASLVRRENDGGNALQQGTEDFPDRIDERQSGLLTAELAVREGVGAPHPSEAVDRRPVDGFDALGRAGRSRRIDDVGQIFRGDTRCEVPVLLGGELRGDVVEPDLSQRILRLKRSGAGLGEHDPRTGVPDHERDAPLRVRGVERHVSRPGLQDREESRHGPGGAFEADPDDRSALDSAAAQVTGESIGLAIELLVSELSRAVADRDSARRPLDLRLEELVETQAVRIIRGRLVPADDDLPPLALAHHRQRLDAAVRIGNDRLQQHAQMAGHPPDRVPFEEIGRVLDQAGEPVRSVFEMKREVELRSRVSDVEVLELQPRPADLAGGCVLERDHCLKERVAAEIPAGMELFHELLERKVLVGVRTHGDVPHPAEKLPECRVP